MNKVMRIGLTEGKSAHAVVAHAALTLCSNLVRLCCRIRLLWRYDQFSRQRHLPATIVLCPIDIYWLESIAPIRLIRWLLSIKRKTGRLIRQGRVGINMGFDIRNHGKAGCCTRKVEDKVPRNGSSKQDSLHPLAITIGLGSCLWRANDENSQAPPIP